jgi:predicted ester cyclase
MTRHFEVVPALVPSWNGMSEAAKVVAAFLARVRVTGDPHAAEELMSPTVLCHQLVADTPDTVHRSPSEYAQHVNDMLRSFGRFRYTVLDFIADEDRVYVRWRQDGHHMLTENGSPGTKAPLTELGSAVYRVEGGRIAEYWIQLDRMGLQHQIDALTASASKKP